jgi:hypothetical protein
MTESVEETHEHVEYCPKHPRSVARLRCNRCGRLMCTKCAVHTPTGYRCEDCVRGQQKVFVTAKPQDYVVGPLVAAILGLLGSIVASNFGFFVLFLAPFAGGIIAEAVRFVVGRRRAISLFRVVAGAVVAGALLPNVFVIVVNLGAGFASLGQLLGMVGLNIVWDLVFAVLAAGATYYRLSGLRL